jgi:hypothetical protein
MTSDNPVADRLVSEARKKGAKLENGPLGIAALVASLIALACAGLIPGAGWGVGVVAIGLSVAGILRPNSAKLSRIGLAVAILAIAVATFFFLKSIGSI